MGQSDFHKFKVGQKVEHRDVKGAIYYINARVWLEEGNVIVKKYAVRKILGQDELGYPGFGVAEEFMEYFLVAAK